MLFSMTTPFWTIFGTIGSRLMAHAEVEKEAELVADQ